MTTINVKIVGDSLSPQGKRITSIIATYPRMIHAEVMTHRLFSRNAASSRAIPFKKMVESVENDPFIPIAWQHDHKGMQGSKYFTDIMDIERCKHSWTLGRNKALEEAKTLANGIGVTKQLANRLLEPFLWYTALITATEWDNFFELRCPKFRVGDQVLYSREEALSYAIIEDPDFYTKYRDATEEEWWMLSESGAEIHIQALAEAIWDAMKESKPKQLKAGEWHIPFGDKMDETELYKVSNQITKKERPDLYPHSTLNKYDTMIRIAVARCARLSYMTFDGEIDYAKDIALHDQLLASRHMSPFEHVARAMDDYEYETHIKGKGMAFIGESGIEFEDDARGWDANFRGFIQYRSLIC